MTLCTRHNRSFSVKVGSECCRCGLIVCVGHDCVKFDHYVCLSQKYIRLSYFGMIVASRGVATYTCTCTCTALLKPRRCDCARSSAAVRQSCLYTICTNKLSATLRHRLTGNPSPLSTQLIPVPGSTCAPTASLPKTASRIHPPTPTCSDHTAALPGPPVAACQPGDRVDLWRASAL